VCFQDVSNPVEFCCGVLVDVTGGKKVIYTYPPRQKTNAVLSVEFAYIRYVKSDPSHPSHRASRYFCCIDRGSENHNRYRFGLYACMVESSFFSEIETHSLVEGHTFGACDQVFSVCLLLLHSVGSYFTDFVCAM
jgi:hypothetical protein